MVSFVCTGVTGIQVEKLPVVIPGGDPGFVCMMLELGTPIMNLKNPSSATLPDFERLVEVCEKNQIHILSRLAG